MRKKHQRSSTFKNKALACGGKQGSDEQATNKGRTSDESATAKRQRKKHAPTSNLILF
jgi:hypothetical protein